MTSLIDLFADDPTMRKRDDFETLLMCLIADLRQTKPPARRAQLQKDSESLLARWLELTGQSASKDKTMQPQESEQSESPLSPQMTVVMQYMALGLTYAQAAERMGISIHTVKAYASRAYARLGTKSRVRATALAVARKLIEV